MNDFNENRFSDGTSNQIANSKSTKEITNKTAEITLKTLKPISVEQSGVKKKFPFPKDFFDVDNNFNFKTNNQPLLPNNIGFNTVKHSHQAKIVIDLQKEFDEDKELLD